MAEKKSAQKTKSRYPKRLRDVREGLDRAKVWSVEEAVAFLKKNATAKFVETIEIALALGIDTRQSDQNVRGMVNLPNGTGKTVRVAVFAKGPKADEARAAGADVVGDEDLMERVQAGNIDFDRVIATPDMMGVVGRLGQILGPKGMMPNPKLGTVTMDVATAVKDAKGGAVQFRAQKEGLVHVGVGKVNFDDAKLVENIRTLVDAVVKAKPQTSKGTYLKRAALSSTMGPGLKLDLSTLVERVA